MTDVIVVGSFVQDHIWRLDRFPQPGETRRAAAFYSGPGGKGFNQAIACARQGVPSAFVGALGDDALGAAAQRFAETERLPCRWQIHADRATATSGIFVDRDGAPMNVVQLDANEALEPAFVVAQDDLFAGAKLLLLQLENGIEATRAALERATRHGLLRVLNPAPVRAEADAALLALCDVITPNETEFALLLDQLAGVQVAADDLARSGDAALHALARRLGVPTVVLTLGAHGCFVSHADGAWCSDEAACYRLAPERVEAIDATGAGDAFSGALAAAIVRFAAQPFRAAVRYANRVAALSTERVGTAPVMPRHGEVAARFMHALG
ncbi:ribokinase [Dokdonella sp.]|uniref:ribokinase n=1 Tax=Dokdonella sp. TaxID=2291710 RepID=UPI001B0DEA27|nr:ribokinase [Dokdonella sp.]MBO9661451.1 ribokinase [Dokdonella sp.]